ncbi:MAG: PTS sugar transporter subunit IIA [Termitinemataceae bacterium]|nr:MAG: PTS sugar transporter subunit IIA [Termitinemataceae bacterium]
MKKSEILTLDNIVVNLPPEGKEDIIRRCGKMLLDSGYVKERYIEGMLKRDVTQTVAIGNLIAIPHGESDYRSDVIKTGLVVLTYKEPIDWSGMNVHFVVGIAALGEDHMDILSNIVDKLETEEDVLKLVKKGDKKAIYKVLCN